MNVYPSIPRRLAKPLFFALLVFLFTLVGCTEDKDYRAPTLPVGLDINKPTIVRFPPADSWPHAQRPMKEFWRAPKWGPTSRDLRQADLSHLNLADKCEELLRSTFDTETKWPDSLPQGFEPGEILEINKNPGLGIRGLHEQGFTGKGIGVAIIDRPPLVNHRECSDRIRYYCEVNVWPPGRADFHGTAVASILGGRDCGVAPEVDIYFVGSYNYDRKKAENGIFVNSTHTERALDLICEINARLPVDKKIRVVSISAGWGPYDPGNKAMKKAVKRAIESGIFVVSANLFESYSPGFWFWGLDRDPLEAADEPSSYRPYTQAEWTRQPSIEEFQSFYTKELRRDSPREFLLIPEVAKAFAHPFGQDSYGYYRLGGWSLVIPWISGLYALACQVKPDMTPDMFWKTALETGHPSPILINKKERVGKIVNPAALIRQLKETF